jgi:hypothetical protein
MIKSGLRNEALSAKILQSGSNALKPKNNSGINVFSGSVLDDGVISGKLTKNKFNNNELVKSIDTNIFELIPPPLPEEPDVVPRPLYNEATQSILDLQEEVERLLVTESFLRGLVTDLRIVSQSLRVQLDSKDLVVASVENQNQQSIEQTQATILDLQNAIQKATSEAIQRTSLTARNETFQLENDRLLKRLEGKEAKKTEGYDVSTTFAWKVLTKKDDSASEDILFNSRAKDKGSVGWINGPKIIINNFTENGITMTFKIEGAVADTLEPIPLTTMAAFQEKVIELKTISTRVRAKTPASGVGTSEDRLYLGTLTATSSDGGTATFSIGLQKQRGGKFSDNPIVVE